jgi:hypothetical protein
LHYSVTSATSGSVVERRNVSSNDLVPVSKSFTTIFSSMACDSAGRLFALRQDSASPTTLKLAQIGSFF